jgi:hypothetical protein
VNQSVISFVPGGLPLSQNLGFEAAAVVCDNYTSSYLTLTDAGKTIPPWTYGAVVSLPPGIRWANATLTATVPAISGPPVPVVQASLTWTDQPLPAAPGHLLQQSSYANQTLVGNVKATAGNTVTPAPFAVPAGTQSIGYLVRSDSGNDTPQSVIIQGAQSKNDYTTAAPTSNIGGVNWYPFSVTDTAVSVTLHANAANPSSIDVLASPLAIAVDVTNPVGNLLKTVVTDAATGTAIPIDNSGAAGASLQVSMVGANPASWQKRRYDAHADSGDPGVGVGASATVAAVPGKVQTCGFIRAEIATQAGVAATVVRFRLRDGASGSGTVLQSWTFAVPATAGALVLLELSGLGFAGTAGNAMSCDFSSSIANAFESCGLGVWQD